MSSDAPPAAAPPSAKDYLAASLEVAKLELTLAAQKVKAINDLVEHGIPLAASSEIAASTDGDGDDAAQIKKKKKRVFIDADGNVIKRAMSGYNMYMTELMKIIGPDGEKPSFGGVASAWKDLSDKEKSDWTVKAKAKVPQSVGEKWIEEEDVPKKKKRKREKSGYNVYVATMMKDGNTKNIQEIAAAWKGQLSDKEREDWNDKAKKNIPGSDVTKVVAAPGTDSNESDDSEENESAASVVATKKISKKPKSSVKKEKVKAKKATIAVAAPSAKKSKVATQAPKKTSSSSPAKKNAKKKSTTSTSTKKSSKKSKKSA